MSASSHVVQQFLTVGRFDGPLVLGEVRSLSSKSVSLSRLVDIPLTTLRLRSGAPRTTLFL